MGFLYKIGFVLLAAIGAAYWLVTLGKKSEKLKSTKDKLSVSQANMKTLKERQRRQDANKKIAITKSLSDTFKRLRKH